MALYRKNCMTLFVDINVIATYDINDINLEVDINVSLPLGTMLALQKANISAVGWCRKTPVCPCMGHCEPGSLGVVISLVFENRENP